MTYISISFLSWHCAVYLHNADKSELLGIKACFDMSFWYVEMK